MSKPNVLTVVGARPQFIKASPVSRALKEAGLLEHLVHTGQHYDSEMSRIFFDELELPEPDINLGIGSGSHGEQTGRMLFEIERVMVEQNPDLALVYGDTNSTLAGALAACKLGVPVAHVEAGLRSFNRSMPEEHNRVLTDHCSDVLFCPTRTAAENLANEGVTKGVHEVGDTMYDAVLHFRDRAAERTGLLADLGVEPGRYLMLTTHRPANVDNPAAFTSILEGALATGEDVVFPVHPRARAKWFNLDDAHAPVKLPERLKLIKPLGYLDTIALLDNARTLLTDSGGMQKEAYWLGTPCITLRDETEWVETVTAGANTLTGANTEKITAAVASAAPVTTKPTEYGTGHAATTIAAILASTIRQ